MELVVTVKKKFVLALIAYAALGVLAWTTLSDEPIQVFDWNLRLRTGTLLILGLLAFKSALFFWRPGSKKSETGQIRWIEVKRC